MPQSPTHTTEEAPEHRGLTHTNNAMSNKEKHRPKSRGSTTSLQSVGVGSAFQPPPQQHDDSTMPLDQNGFYVQHGGHHQAAAMYGPNPDEMLMHYPHNMTAHLQQHPPMDASGGMPQHEMRPMPQQTFQEMQHFPVQYPHGLPPYAVAPQHMHHMRHHSEQFEGSPAPEDSNTENGGAKRRKGTASSVANDQELRRLLAQYQGKSLKEVAAEVQKNEGSGGKSEKAKQVFAMLWLQENCQRSSNSVRRDRVFTRYTERCGNERVPTLNPASFGKLVRIIFPNVQTRRLGVRGESKYHYVDLSLVVDDDDRQYVSTAQERPGTADGSHHERRGSHADTNKLIKARISPSIERPLSRAAVETADFPAPSAAFLPQESAGTEEVEPQPTKPQLQKLDCKYINTPTIRLPYRRMPANVVAALPSVRPNLPASMATYLGMPTLDSLSQVSSSSQDAPVEFPDIFPYLEGVNYDASIAKALFHLYRSYCIDVIDAFRKCKEKPFFNHHSAFNGKMTVPVSKLFSMACLAPWIQECDMRMYKQIVRFIAPLAVQNVPDVVWNVFDRIGSRLVSHLISAFEEKCPVHVVVAKTVPAARFANLLKKLKGANAATLQLSRMLEDPQQRTQMWLDLMAMVEPERMLEESMPPPESLERIEGVLKHDMRPLVLPVDGELVRAAEEDPTSAYANFLSDNSGYGQGLLPLDSNEQPTPLLEKWINWLERLPQLFEGHHPQCMIDWHSRFWSSLMMQMGQNGAHSYQSWWFVESFTTQMLCWMTQMEGLLMDEESQKLADEREQEKSREIEPHLSTSSLGRSLKRKRAEDDIEGEANTTPELEVVHQTKKLETSHESASTLPSVPAEEPTATQQVDDDETDAELDELRQGGPLDLPSFHTGLSSPVKRQPGTTNTHDDSGIDLGLDVDAEAEKEAKKFNKRDWLLSSDPVDSAVGLGVLV
ncbi:hypothetical protein HRR83_002307 [Exophiala dermatitidis]|uniref:RFX-type winged-helix domain-containing protein n=1 Tax=Exophiala dermatitidis TaxID=5970 RepID=A0AAN6EXT0_EXODE|nr:hypothetical protein HRR74_002384 [Exophiala dermatitidis]KAJ4525541.1 hypothetical protein HRR73_002271 [Exophiala dermatitidis]KAJ4536858.1 hypothetical protein HRR76_004884 [Exophiala dermatitidis]KAJ4555541.1 hypothetical protein HRR77_001471 [Exophiala dermatitidis]KAJ4568845.1 hypothetical protein HRR81_006502 [Exophiala dermatitidis]